MEIRKSTPSEKMAILDIHAKAFGEQKGPVISKLVSDMLGDATALPRLSLVAVENEKLAGHILFSSVKIRSAVESVSAQILAPLAVHPDYQKTGVGTQLIKEGLTRLKESGVKLVFVLGHPDYYPRCGFTPAGVFGFGAPYPIPNEYADAWMVKDLCSGFREKIQGCVQCCDVLDQPEHWRE